MVMSSGFICRHARAVTGTRFRSELDVARLHDTKAQTEEEGDRKRKRKRRQTWRSGKKERER
jgi:hypothetical protein